MSTATPAITRLSAATARPLAAMLAQIEASGEREFFDPHPFDCRHLSEILCAPGVQDLYFVCSDGETVLAYGLLRGWDEGYAIPSLGLAVSPTHRGLGLGDAMMHWLHCVARLRGCEQVRLRVDRRNDTALSLYRRMGYRFDNDDGNATMMTGFKWLRRR